MTRNTKEPDSPRATPAGPGRDEVPPEVLQRLRTCTSFPTPPPVAMQIVQLAQMPDIDLPRVADAVSVDPAIAAKVMRIANSAMYARRRQSTNLRQALIVLGLNATLTLALSFTLVGTLRRNPPTGFDFHAYWRRAILSAAWGKLLASTPGRRDAEEVFLAALLQDIGMLAVDKIWPDTYSTIAPFTGEHALVSQHEQKKIGTDHRAIGAALLDIWNMPENMVRAVQHSHDPLAGNVAAEHRAFVRAIALSGELSDAWLMRDNEMALQRVSQKAYRYLGIHPNRLAEMFVTIGEQLPVAESIFEMSLFDASQTVDILETAREILVVRNLRDIAEKQDLESRRRSLERENVELKEESAKDPLTGVYNRRYFEEALEREFEAAARHSWPLSIVFVDIDRFKLINDTFGHHPGDLVLQEVARTLRACLRDSDVIARYGGDEFVLLLPGCDTTQADVVGARVVELARQRGVKAADGRDINITLSLGLATADAGNRFPTARDLVTAADQALYHSKRNGRDRSTAYAAIRAA